MLDTATSVPEVLEIETLKGVPRVFREVQREMAQQIVGQQCAIRDLLVSLFAGGHCLMIGAPGLAKTLMVRSLANTLALDFRRIQFTPDLMPGDILGSEILEETSDGKRGFRFVAGPLFGQIVLADEINRTPPKTQAALLEAMQEKSITVAGTSHALRSPFFVLATQNPVEQEGTFPLPEAQLDRFMFCLNIDYPSRGEEIEILLRTTGAPTAPSRAVLKAEDILSIQRAIRTIAVPQSIAELVVDYVRRTRPASPDAPASVKRFVRWGAGPRAAQFLTLAAKVHAALNGRLNIAKDDVVASAPLVLRHRLILNYRAEAEQMTTDALIADLISGA